MKCASLPYKSTTPKELNYMKKIHLLLIAFLLTMSLYASNIFAQGFTRQYLPKDAKARFGRGWVKDIKFSPYSNQLAVATTIGVWIYDLQTGTDTNLFEDIMGGANAVSYSPLGTTVAAAHADWTVRLWDTSSGKEKPDSALRGHTAEIHAVEYSPDGSRIASGSADKTIRIWNPGTTTDSKKLIAILPYKDAVRTLAFSPDGKILAGGSDDGTIQVWDAGTGDRIYEFKEHTGSVQAVHFSRTRTELVSASLDGTAILWSLVGEGGKLRAPAQNEAPIYAVKFSPDGNTFATGSANKLIQLWNTGTADHKLTLTGHTDLVADIDFSSDGSSLASGSPDGMIHLWDIIGERTRIKISGHTGGVKALVYTEDNRIRSCGVGFDGKLRLWDAGTSSELSVIREHTGLTQSVAFSKDGKILASGGSKNGTIFLSDVLKILENNEKSTNDSPIKTLKGNIHGITALAFSPADTTLASGGSDGKIHLLDISSGSELKILRGSQSAITALTFVIDGTHLFSGEENGDVRQWDALTGKKIRDIDGSLSSITALSFSSINHCLAIGDALGTIQLFDLVTGMKTRIPSSDDPIKHPSKVTSLIFHEDGDTLVSGNENGTTILWDIRSILSEER